MYQPYILPIPYRTHRTSKREREIKQKPAPAASCQCSFCCFCSFVRLFVRSLPSRESSIKSEGEVLVDRDRETQHDGDDSSIIIIIIENGHSWSKTDRRTERRLHLFHFSYYYCSHYSQLVTVL
jgi:hypothetical protein